MVRRVFVRLKEDTMVGGVKVAKGDRLWMTWPEPTKHEVEVLQMLANKRAPKWGAQITASLESLASQGLCVEGETYKITKEGRNFLSGFPARKRKALSNGRGVYTVSIGKDPPQVA